jgi:hypothetical protein
MTEEPRYLIHYRLDYWGSMSGRGKRIFPVGSVYRAAVGPTPTPVLFSGGKARLVTLSTHPHLGQE